MKYSYLAILLASAAWAASAGVASAQTVPPVQAEEGQSAEADAADSSTDKPQSKQDNGDIIVTARRRAERLQDVPIAVTALQGATLEKSTYKNLTDIQYLAPSVNVNNSLFYPSYQIRGVGTQTYDTGAEASVGIVVDGVADGNTRSIGINSLTDLDRIEVLRGPQGTLFGKNSSAGVIQIITKQPEIGVWNAVGVANYGTDNEEVASLAINVPISSTLAARVTGYYQHRDGYIDNYDGTNLGFQTDKGIRAKLMWKPSDRLTVTAIGYATRNDNTFGYGTLRSFGVATGPTSFRDLVGALGIVPSPENRRAAIYGGNTAYFNTNNQGGSLQVDYDLGNGYSLTSISAYKGWDLGSQFPITQAPVPYFDFNRGRGYHTDQWTQEIRVQSPANPLVFTAGLYFYDYILRATQLQGGTFGLPVTPGMRYSGAGGQMNFNNENTSYAAFVDGTYRVSDKFRVFAGGRFTHDDVYASLFVTPVPDFVGFGPLQPPFSGTVRADDFSWRFGGQYELSSDVMAYATMSRGYKGPVAASLNNGAINNVRPEIVYAKEIGIKSLFFNRRLMINLAAFHSRFKDFQATIIDDSLNPPAARLTNAKSLTSQGVELDAQFRITPHFSLSANGSFDDATYGEIFTSCYPLQPVTSSPANGACAPIPGAPGLNYASMEGLPLATSPRLTFSVAADYWVDLAPKVRADASIRYSWRDKSRSNPVDPNTQMDPYGLLNANIGVSATDGSWRVAVYGRNLLKQNFVSDIYATFFDDGGYTQNPTSESERTIGVSVMFRL